MPFKKGGGHHKGRKGGRASLAAARTPTPKVVHDDVDDEMDDDGEGDEAQDTTMQYDFEEDAATPAQDDDEEEEDEDESPRPKITSMPRRRGRAGRPRTRVDNDQTSDQGDGSESGTPMRRRRGRPPGSGTGSRARGGFRGRRKGQAPEPPRFIIDKEGNSLDVVDDEAIVDDDPEGNEKVDSKGNLQGGREYRVRTFKIMGKEDRLYMLSTEPARCTGFRDSYLFFTKHPKLYKVLLGDEEKKDLISRDILPNSYKGRNIGVVTARSVFREFGARIIVGGRKVTDDYKVAEARANGEVEGELADADDHVPDKLENYNRNRYVAWFGASEVYRQQAGSGGVPAGKPGPLGKRRNNITLENWQLVHAREASRFNTQLAALRHANSNGIYDNNTNMMFFPKIMQPTHAKWEVAPLPEETSAPPLTNGLVNGHSGDLMEVDATLPASKIFSPVPAVISRNFTVIDTIFESPPISNAGYPGPDGSITDPTSGPNGLSSMSPELVDELPPDCRAAFEEARATELRWKRSWGTEAQSGHRGHLKIGFSGYPV